MTAPDASPVEVGRQLSVRRDELDITQDELAQRIGISARTVSAVERGVNSISKGRRADWEAALGLKAGTIGRAYRTGTLIEALPDSTPPAAPSAGNADRAALIRDVRDRLARNAEEQQALQEQLFRLIGGQGSRETG